MWISGGASTAGAVDAGSYEDDGSDGADYDPADYYEWLRDFFDEDPKDWSPGPSEVSGGGGGGGIGTRAREDRERAREERGRLEHGTKHGRVTPGQEPTPQQIDQIIRNLRMTEIELNARVTPTQDAAGISIEVSFVPETPVRLIKAELALALEHISASEFDRLFAGIERMWNRLEEKGGEITDRRVSFFIPAPGYDLDQKSGKIIEKAENGKIQSEPRDALSEAIRRQVDQTEKQRIDELRTIVESGRAMQAIQGERDARAEAEAQAETQARAIVEAEANTKAAVEAEAQARAIAEAEAQARATAEAEVQATRAALENEAQARATAEAEVQTLRAALEAAINTASIETQARQKAEAEAEEARKELIEKDEQLREWAIAQGIPSGAPITLPELRRPIAKPTKATTKTKAKTPVKAPSKPTKATMKTKAKTPVKAPSKPTKATTKTKAKTPVKAPSKPTKATTKTKAKTPVKAPSKPTTKTPIKAPQKTNGKKETTKSAAVTKNRKRRV